MRDPVGGAIEVGLEGGREGGREGGKGRRTVEYLFKARRLEDGREGSEGGGRDVHVRARKEQEQRRVPS